MTSTASGRYNNEANTDISLGDVGTATGLAAFTGTNNIGSYRNRVGIQLDDVKFSDLKGIYAGNAGITSDYITLDATNYSSYLTHFNSLSNKTTVADWEGMWYQLSNAYLNDDPLPVIYQKNVTTGGFNYGVRYRLNSNEMVITRGNVLLKTIMWKNYTLAFGKFDGTERAICCGPIEMKSVDGDYTTAYGDVGNVFTLNAMIGQDYFYDYSVFGSQVGTTFRTTTRTKMIGLWKKTDGLLYHAWLDTAPFISGASLSGTYVGSLEQGLIDQNWRAYGHKNNQITFGIANQYASYSQAVNPGKNYPTTEDVGYYVLLMYDIGLRNATSGSVLNSNKSRAGKTSTNDVPGFSQ